MTRIRGCSRCTKVPCKIFPFFLNSEADLDLLLAPTSPVRGATVRWHIAHPAHKVHRTLMRRTK